MCDFHSVVCYLDGAIYHAASNSHTAAVKLSGRPENDGIRRFVEAEWDGHGKYPGAEKITRGEPNERQIRAIDAHYQSLVEVLKTGDFHGIWSEPGYADVRRQFARRCRVARLPEFAEKLLSDATWEVRHEFAARCPAARLPEHADRMLADLASDMRFTFARRCPAENLAEFGEKLRSDPDWMVRREFARRCPTGVTAPPARPACADRSGCAFAITDPAVSGMKGTGKMTTNKEFDVAPGKLSELADRMLADDDWQVRFEFAFCCPAEHLPEFADRLLTDRHGSVRTAFAGRCPPDRLAAFGDRILGDADWCLRVQFVRRCPLDRLAEFGEKLRSDPDWMVRREFARRCPTD